MKKTNLVFLGHVDHGKSTLIGRLLFDTNSIPEEKIQEIKKASEEQGKEMEFAFFLDNLEEERKDEMTIDVIYSSFKTEDNDFLIIDCPGHKELIKNMMSGASNADSAVLVLSAKEGIEEQTKRHAFLAKNFGIDQFFVAINKMDLIDYNKDVFEKIKKEIEEFLLSIGVSKGNLFFIPISAKKGENISKKSDKMPWQEKTILQTVDENIIKKQENKQQKIIFVQDIYEVDNKKLIIGKVESGTIKIGDSLSFNLTDQDAILRSIESFNEKKSSAEIGESVGLVFDNIEFKGLRRGEVLSDFSISPKLEFDARIFPLLDNCPISSGEFKITCGTAESKCDLEILRIVNSSTMHEIQKKDLKNEEFARVKIKPLDKIVVDKFSNNPSLGRFILEQESKIVAAGIIL